MPTLLKNVAESRRLEECVRLRSGKTPPRNRPEFWDGDIPWISAKDLKSFRLTDAEEHISEAAVAAGAPIARAGELLILVRGMTLIKDVPIAILGADASFNQDLKALTPINGVRADYLGYVLEASKFRLMAMVDRAGHGTGRLAIEKLVSLPVLKPDASVQTYIEIRLRVFDRLLEAQEALIECKNKLKRRLRQQLLTGKKRFPEFAGQPWVERRLVDLFTERSETNRSDLPLLSVTNDRGIIPRDELDKRDTSNPDKSKYKRVAIGDIAYNTMRMWQGVSALSSLEGIVSPAYTVAVPSEQIDASFAKHLFKYPPVVHLFLRHSQGLVDDTLNLKFDRFAKITVRIPRGVEEQRRIAAALDLCDREAELLSALATQYETYKRGVLSRLLSGDLQVPAS